jgi:hypothetical protein
MIRRSVYKYELMLGDILVFELPVGAQVLHVDTQDDGASEKVVLWALVDLEVTKKEFVRIRIAGTGHLIDCVNLKYINTFTIRGRDLWFHAFEIL